MEVVQDKGRLLASVDGAHDRISDDNSFLLTRGKNGFRPARIDPLSPGVSPDLAWLTLDNAADVSAAEAALSQFWEKAYSGWASSSSFSSQLVDAWSREALARGEYPAAFSKIQTLLSRGPRTWGFEAVSYLGDVVALTAQHRRAVEADSSRSQPDWVGLGPLWRDAQLYGPKGSADRVKELLLGNKLPDDAPRLVAVLQNLMTIQADQPSEAVATRIKEVLKSLQTMVIRSEGGLFVKTSQELLDLRSALILE
jgi:hypothetical protein